MTTRDWQVEAFRFAAHPADAYRLASVPKPQAGVGEYRTLEIPCANLAMIQRRVLDLYGPLFAHDPADHGRKGYSYITHACYHAAPAVLVTLDIKDFFGSVPFDDIVSVLAAARESCVFGRVLAHVCTNSKLQLPQGACTSPALAGAAFRPVDARIAKAVAGFWPEVRYSRYVDDMAFSWPLNGQTSYEVGRLADRCVKTLVDCVADLVAQQGPYRLNPAKTCVALPWDAQEVTGLVVNDNPGGPPVRAPVRHWKRLRTGVHNLRAGRPAEPLPSLQGLAAFCRQVEPKRAEPYIQALQELDCHGED